MPWGLRRFHQARDLHFITGYVVMPEHVHLLVSEPERGTLALADRFALVLPDAATLFAAQK